MILFVAVVITALGVSYLCSIFESVLLSLENDLRALIEGHVGKDQPVRILTLRGSIAR